MNPPFALRFHSLRAFQPRLLLLLSLPFLFVESLHAQGDIESMRWGSDYKLHVSLNNSDSYVVDVRGLHHESGAPVGEDRIPTMRYLPVAIDKDFLHYLKSKPLALEGIPAEDSARVERSYRTLWSALHREIGGGYVHLLNCIIYALESGHLQLDHVMLQRPVSRWKPDPMTESYRRTRKWHYYTSVTQREAKREYRLRKKEGSLQDLAGIPQSFIDLFLKSSDRDVRRMKAKGERDRVAQIDLVKMMIGARYLGENQIRFISQCVRNAIRSYTANNMPSVIIFDDYQAAVAMRLDRDGYRIDYIVFQNQQDLAKEEIERRERVIYQLVQNINEANAQVFRRRLQAYYDN